MMATSTKGISCPPNVFTLLADGKANVNIRLRTKGTGRLAIAATQPVPSTADYFSLSQADQPDLSSMTSGDRVWFMPDAGSVVVEVKSG